MKIKNFFIFTIQLGRKTLDDDLFALSNELAYKILLSIFPFIVFLVSLLGFLNLQEHEILTTFEMLPPDISQVLIEFVEELQERPSRSILSISLLVALYSASNGFRAVIRGVNKAHDYKDNRSFIKKTAICAVLMLIFTFSILVMLVLWVFSSQILMFLTSFLQVPTNLVIRISSVAISLIVMVICTTWIYRLACVSKGRFWPGACVTVVLWAISSELFAIFIGNFSNISVIYGSIAGVFILVVWINLISFFLLLGNTVNALLNSADYTQ